MVYIDIVRRSLNELTISNIVTRRELYEQLKTGLKATLDSVEPPIDSTDKDLEFRLLGVTIRKFELDLRDGVDVWSEDYNPAELEEAQAKLYSFKKANRVTRIRPAADGARTPTGLAANSSEQNACSNQLIERLRFQMAQLSKSNALVDIGSERPLAPSILRAVLVRKLRDVSAKNSLGLLWLILEPAMYIGVIVAVYTWMGRTDVMDMEIAPFAVSGVITMMMLRQTLMRVSTTITSDVNILALPPVHLISVALCQGAVIYLSFLSASTLALFLIVLFDFGPPPVDWQLVLVIWTMIWLLAVALGIILGYVSTYTKIITQTMSIGFRFISALSGIFFVSEQFPAEYSSYLLWNPLLHGLQLLRSAYFAGYKSTDASWDFFLCCAGLTIAYAAACERLARPRIEPA